MNLIEHMAALEHRQWMQWTQYMLESDHVEVSDEKREHWESLMVPYVELSPEQQSNDVRYALPAYRMAFTESS